MPIARAVAPRRGRAARRGARRADRAAGPGDVPAVVVVLGRDRDADAQLNLAAQHERAHRGGAARLRRRRQREQRCRDRRGGMDHRREMRVVVVVDVPGEAVGERGEVRVGTHGAADDRRDRRAAGLARDAQDGVDAGIRARADRDGQDVEERTFRFVQHRLGQIGERERRRSRRPGHA